MGDVERAIGWRTLSGRGGVWRGHCTFWFGSRASAVGRHRVSGPPGVSLESVCACGNITGFVCGLGCKDTV